MVRWIAYAGGVIAIVVGARWIVKRSIEVGIEGRTPAFILRGGVAVLLGIIAILLGVYILWNPDILSNKIGYENASNHLARYTFSPA